MSGPAGDVFVMSKKVSQFCIGNGSNDTVGIRVFVSDYINFIFHRWIFYCSIVFLKSVPLTAE